MGEVYCSIDDRMRMQLLDKIIIIAEMISCTHRFIFAVRVLVGVYQKGKDGQKVPDAQPSGQPYDSTVDDETNPTILVIYHDVRAYPEFLYEFT